MQPRLTSKLLVSGLLRRAESQGGYGAVIAKGDPTAGAIAVILAERGRKARFLERILQPDGHYSWQDAAPPEGEEAEFDALLTRRRRVDPDLWVIELDVASAERFAAEMNAIG